MVEEGGGGRGSRGVWGGGGVALNWVANGKIFDATPFEEVYVHPAAGDAGLAVGAAYYVWHQKLGKPRSFVMDHAYWGPGYTREEIRRAIDANGLAQSGYSIAELREEELALRAAAIIADGKNLRWLQCRADFRSPRSHRGARGDQQFLHRQRADWLPPRRGDRLLPAHADGCPGPRRFPHLAPLTISCPVWIPQPLARVIEMWQAIGHGKQGQRQTRNQEAANEETNRA